MVQMKTPWVVFRNTLMLLGLLSRYGLRRISSSRELLPTPYVPLYEEGPRLSLTVVIPTRDKPELLIQAVASLGKIGEKFELIIINNQSAEPSTLLLLEDLARNGAKIIDYDSRFNFSEICNLGASLAQNDLILFMNNDCQILTPNWLDETQVIFQDYRVGTLGPAIKRSTGAKYQLGLIFGEKGIASPFFPKKGFPENGISLTVNSFAFICVRRAAFAHSGGLDAKFPVGLNDIDFTFRLSKAGWLNVATSRIKVIHDEFGTRHKIRSLRGWIRALLDVWLFLKKWQGEELRDYLFKN